MTEYWWRGVVLYHSRFCIWTLKCQVLQSLKCLLLKFKCQQFFCIYTTLIFQLKKPHQWFSITLALLWFVCQKVQRLIWSGEWCLHLQKTKHNSSSLLQSLILCDTSVVILASWRLCLENFSVIKWQYERYLNAKVRQYLHFYNWSCCNFFASLMAMWFCSLIPWALITSFVHPCNPLERQKQWYYYTHSVDRQKHSDVKLKIKK